MSIEIITSAPSSAAFIVPRPPNSDVPPITAAAIGYSSAWPPPVFVSTERSREARMIPPSTASSEQSAKHAILTRSTSMPARRAASCVAADRVDVAAEARAVEHVRQHEQQRADQDPAVRDAAILVGDGDDDRQHDREPGDPQPDDHDRVVREPGLLAVAQRTSCTAA